MTEYNRMDCKILATSFVKSFCAGDIEALASVLSGEFRLRGPLCQFDSKQSYIDSLRGNLETDTQAVIISVIGSEHEASAFYTYHGNTIGQLFRCREGKIHETILAFDPGKIA